MRFRGGLSPSPIGLSPIGAARVNVFDTEKVSHTLPDMRIPKVLLHSPKNEFLAQKWPNLTKNWHFGPFDPMPEQKTMQTSCLGSFYIMWIPKLLLTPIKIRIFGP